jgi:hypothetical protein
VVIFPKTELAPFVGLIGDHNPPTPPAPTVTVIIEPIVTA